MLYDLSTLRKLSDNDETFIIDMLQTYKRTTPPALERMQEYLTQQKNEAIGREAHKMIPGVSFLGARQLQEVLVKIEETAKSGEGLKNMPELVAEAIKQSNELIVCFENDFPGKI
ncbi:MAG: Hpt domain-containing protein [Bacteroidales bacterium]|nr:Hpt domain-containing protein [Bacteroidales bacterium]